MEICRRSWICFVIFMIYNTGWTNARGTNESTTTDMSSFLEMFKCPHDYIALSAAAASIIFLVVVIVFVCIKRKSVSSPTNEEGSFSSKERKTKKRREQPDYYTLEALSEVDGGINKSTSGNNKQQMTSENPTETAEKADNVLNEIKADTTAMRGDIYDLAGAIGKTGNTSDRRSKACHVDENKVYCSDDDEEMIMVENDLYDSS